jgi:hypothetical protein
LYMIVCLFFASAFNSHLSISIALCCISTITCTFVVMTLVLGSWPMQRHGKVWAKNATQESHFHSRECEGMNPTHSQVDSHFGSCNPYGNLNLQKDISRVKTHCIKKFLKPLESSWNIDV